MTTFLKNKTLTNELCIHQYSADKAALTEKVHELFISSGYTLAEGSDGNGIYTKGSRVMRLLFGAFIKYFKFGVEVKQSGDSISEVTVTRKTSGMSGGLIGMNQVKNELKKLAALLQTL